MDFKYQLQSDSFSLWDRFKASLFLLNKNNKLTMGPRVYELEQEWYSYTGSKVVATSSGSTANILLVETFLQTFNYKPQDVVVFCPATTWASSISCWTMRGCKVVFVDINLNDFCFDYNELEKELEKNDIYGKKIKVIWPTGLIGNPPDIKILRGLADQHNAFLFADLCECSLTKDNQPQILGEFDMATTSLFWAHQINGIELGLLFIQNFSEKYQDKIDNSRMIRNHGLVRSLHQNNRVRKQFEASYPDIDSEFLFVREGTNLRPTDLNAYFALMDFERVGRYVQHRCNIWEYYLQELPGQFLQLNKEIVPFCLPLIFHRDYSNPSRLPTLKTKLKSVGWESRPVISWISHAPAYRHLAKGKKFPNSQYLHENGCYVGLSNKLNYHDVDLLLEVIKEV
jgi:dTDP-4-amino-4,6-dideoxygalactose transaminase